MNKNLIIFIDGLPWFIVEDLGIKDKFDYFKPLQPGFGYSINIHWELFGGKTADEVGFLNEWGLRDTANEKSALLNLFSLAKYNYYLDRGLHKLLSYFIGPIGNIPFNVLHYFEKIGRNVFRDTIDKSIFHAVKAALPETNELGKRDQSVFVKAIKLIEEHENNILVSFEDLDYLSHYYGINSAEYRLCLRELEKNITELYKLFLKKNKNVRLIILSDHGMSSVVNSVPLNFEKNIGKVGQDSYLYFIDSTMVRAWFFKDDLRAPFLDYLSQFNQIKRLSLQDRKRFGVTNIKFGHEIFLIDEGFVFSPDFFGRKVPKAMHGYHPEASNQQGVLMIKGERSNVLDKLNINRTLDVPKIFHKMCGLGWSE
jgi:hypothetical protein